MTFDLLICSLTVPAGVNTDLSAFPLLVARLGDLEVIVEALPFGLHKNQALKSLNHPNHQ